MGLLSKLISLANWVSEDIKTSVRRHKDLEEIVKKYDVQYDENDYPMVLIQNKWYHLQDDGQYFFIIDDYNQRWDL